MFELRYLGELLGWACYLPYDLAATFEPANEDESAKHQALLEHLKLAA